MEEATWEDYEDVAKQFSNLSLEDKGVLEGGGNGEAPRQERTDPGQGGRKHIGPTCCY